MDRLLGERMLQNAASILSIVSICAWCKRVKVANSDNNSQLWQEANNEACHHDLSVSHGICPECKSSVMTFKRN